MYELQHIPTAVDAVVGPLLEEGEGVRAVRSGGDTISLFPGALRALQRVHAGEYDGAAEAGGSGALRLALASSANTPRAVAIGRAALGLLEVAPGATVLDVLRRGWPAGFEGHLQVGRSPPLSAQKWRTHFPALRDATGVPYGGMLFFDDANWDDHCALVAARCPGVVAQRTPRGLTEAEWEAGLRAFAHKKCGTKKGAV